MQALLQQLQQLPPRPFQQLMHQLQLQRQPSFTPTAAHTADSVVFAASQSLVLDAVATTPSLAGLLLPAYGAVAVGPGHGIARVNVKNASGAVQTVILAPYTENGNKLKKSALKGQIRVPGGTVNVAVTTLFISDETEAAESAEAAKTAEAVSAAEAAKAAEERK